MARLTHERFDITWVDGGREPQCDPDPAYPEGIDLDVSKGQKSTCKVVLPYPAQRIGNYVVKCHLCGLLVTCTTAGRPDDPRSITLPCKTLAH